MAWNPSSKVAVARDFGKTFNKEIVIILSINDKGELEYASYGTTKDLCGEAERLADAAFDAVMKKWVED